VVELVPRPGPQPCDRILLARIAEAAFGQRRKMLRQSLKTFLPDPIPVLEAAGIAPTDRAEHIPVEGFVRLANAARGNCKTPSSKASADRRQLVDEFLDVFARTRCFNRSAVRMPHNRAKPCQRSRLTST
jgi:hypothetical protein